MRPKNFTRASAGSLVLLAGGIIARRSAAIRRVLAPAAGLAIALALMGHPPGSRRRVIRGPGRIRCRALG